MNNIIRNHDSKHPGHKNERLVVQAIKNAELMGHISQAVRHTINGIINKTIDVQLEDLEGIEMPKDYKLIRQTIS